MLVKSFTIAIYLCVIYKLWPYKGTWNLVWLDWIECMLFNSVKKITWKRLFSEKRCKLRYNFCDWFLKLYSNLKTWKRSNYFSRFVFTRFFLYWNSIVGFFRENVALLNVEKRKKLHSLKFFFVKSFVKPLLSRNFCQ